MQNIAQIKQALGLETINFTSLEKEWYSCFNNDNRTLIAAHSSVVSAIKGGANNLFIKKETKTGSKGEYTLVLICQSKTEILETV